ncbi:hypothetical protein OAR04_01695 [Flavobacteriales bacterium]|nr:hypothetical protein [Flavobacteriales bacterium]
MGSTHLYVVDSSRFDFSFGYPLQDDLSTGLISMQYGIDPCYDSVLTISNDSTWHCYLTTGCQWAGSNPSFPGQYNSLSDCQAACNSTTINNIDGNKPKILMKVIDILVRESIHLKNQPLFYIYDDGSIEKKIIRE